MVGLLSPLRPPPKSVGDPLIKLPVWMMTARTQNQGHGMLHQGERLLFETDGPGLLRLSAKGMASPIQG